MTASPDIGTTHRFLSTHEAATAFSEIWDIYVAAIPASERKDRHTLRQMTQRPEYAFHVTERAGRVQAFGIVYQAQNGAFALLEYFATDEAVRNQGIGGALLRHIFAAHGDAPILLEVETPPGGSGESIEARRIAFYRRHGARVIDSFHYVLPLKTDTAPPPMSILIAGAGGDQVVQTETLRGWIAEIYRDVYGAPSDNDDFLAMFSNLPAEMRLT